jgi:hypothetical protein
MKKSILCKTAATATMLLALSMPCHSQLNLQLHRDFGHALYGKELKSRPNLTLTLNFSMQTNGAALISSSIWT